MKELTFLSTKIKQHSLFFPNDTHFLMTLISIGNSPSPGFRFAITVVAILMYGNWVDLMFECKWNYIFIEQSETFRDIFQDMIHDYSKEIFQNLYEMGMKVKGIRFFSVRNKIWMEKSMGFSIYYI